MPFQYSWPNLWAVAGTLIVACALLIFRWNAEPFKRTALAVVLMQSICITYAAWGLLHRDRLLMRYYQDWRFEDRGLGLSLISLLGAMVWWARSRKVVPLLACASAAWLLIVWIITEFSKY
jgi:hypothetical protein